MVISNQILAQTTIWTENFSYSNDVDTGTGTGVSATNWTSGNGVLIRSNSIETRSKNDAGFWRTDPINVKGFKGVEISFSIGNESTHKNNRFAFRYRLDEGTWINLVDLVEKPNSNYSFTIPNGSTLELEALFNTQNGSGNGKYILDDVLLTGTPPPCTNSLEYEFYDLLPSGNSVDNIPTSGALSNGQIGSFNVGALQNTVDAGDTDSFSIRYTGYILITTPGSYTFYTTSDDGSKLFIDGVQIVNNDGNHGSQERSGTITLTKGFHQITVLFFENTGGEVLEVRYQGPSISKQPIPFSVLHGDKDCVPVIDPGEDNLPPVIEAMGDQSYCPGEAIPIVQSVSITDPDDTDLWSVFIQIATNYDNTGDVLSLTGSHPGITASWDVLTGKLSMTGPATLADFEAAILQVEFNTTVTPTTGTVKEFSIVMAEANYLLSTQHYYEYIPAVGITWTAARDAAELRTFYGLQGYLATLTNTDEADLLGKQSSGAGWIGASDAAVEGQWLWVTGPEAGNQFWNGAQGGAVTMPHNYANWNNGEPNNSGNEDYAHINAPGTGFDGSWNDLSNTGAGSGNYQPKGYLVEYGGMPGDPPYPQISAVTTITVDNIDPTASNPTPVNVNCIGDIPLPDPTVVTDEADNCTLNPTVVFVNDVSDGGSNPEIITRTYRVTDASGNGIDVTQNITVNSYSISSEPTNQTIFAGTSANFTVLANNVDTYQWQLSTDGGTIFNNISDGAEYAGTQSTALTVKTAGININGYRYRVLISKSGAGCPTTFSSSALLTVKVKTVITNRRITHRVDL